LTFALADRRQPGLIRSCPPARTFVKKNDRLPPQRTAEAAAETGSGASGVSSGNNTLRAVLNRFVAKNTRRTSARWGVGWCPLFVTTLDIAAERRPRPSSAWPPEWSRLEN